jgi:hypothetical protein
VEGYNFQEPYNNVKASNLNLNEKVNTIIPSPLHDFTQLENIMESELNTSMTNQNENGPGQTKEHSFILQLDESLHNIRNQIQNQKQSLNNSQANISVASVDLKQRSLAKKNSL